MTRNAPSDVLAAGDGGSSVSVSYAVFVLSTVNDKGGKLSVARLPSTIGTEIAFATIRSGES